MTADQFNGLLELLGGLFVLGHCRAVWRDRAVAGVSVSATVFFFAWGMWNLYYYPSLGQWFSLAGGIFLAGCNALWIALLIRFGGARRG